MTGATRPRRLALRARDAVDVPALLVLLQRVHETEGYPVRPAAVNATWLTSLEKPGVPLRPDLASWVSLDGERLTGHVALHPAGGPCLPLWIAATGRDADGIAVVARLYTDRTVPGCGSALLEAAVDGAHVRGLACVLEVDAASPAYGFYLRRGWHEAGRTPQQWGPRLVETAALIAPPARPVEPAQDR